jgi:hypothetical protein
LRCLAHLKAQLNTMLSQAPVITMACNLASLTMLAEHLTDALGFSQATMPYNPTTALHLLHSDKRYICVTGYSY